MDGRVKRKTFADLMAEAALQGAPEDKTTADLLNVPLSRGAILPLTEYLDRAEFDLSSGLPGAFAAAVTAPARAARGEISEDQQIPEAFNFAGSLTLGSLLAPRPTGSVGMGGRAAKGALDMSEAARMARAKEMGFDTDQTWYHGTYRDFDKFDPNIRLPVKDVLTGNEIDNPFDPLGAVFFSDNPSIASNPRYTGFPSDPGRVIPAHIRVKNVKTVDMKGGAGGEDVIIKQAKNDGYDAIKFINMEDVGSGGLQTQIAVFDPSNIRSVNAAFDPAKSSSANILAANAKTGAAVPLATKALEAQQPQGIRAFHGSPHDFERFDMSKIGTGEGAQAYGHGLYFAEAEDVAKTYREPVTGGWGGERFTVNGLDEDQLPIHVRQAVAYVGREAGDGPLDAAAIEKALQGARAAVERYEASKDPSVIRHNLPHARDTLRGLEEIKGAKLGRKQIGHMYEVNIKADPDAFIDYDIPLGQQSEAVRRALDEAGLMPYTVVDQAGNRLDFSRGMPKAEAERFAAVKGGRAIPKDDADFDAVRKAQMMTGRGDAAQADIATALREAGIPGIRYLDQMSRGAGEGSSNYVVFDDAIIDIVKKYGIAGLALLQAAGYGTNEGEETQ